MFLWPPAASQRAWLHTARSWADVRHPRTTAWATASQKSSDFALQGLGHRLKSRPMKSSFSSTGKSRLDNNPKWDDIQICIITGSARRQCCGTLGSNDNFAMKSFYLYRPACPHCGRHNTSLDCGRAMNLVRVPLAILSGLVITPLCRIAFICRDCRCGFLSFETEAATPKSNP